MVIRENAFIDAESDLIQRIKLQPVSERNIQTNPIIPGAQRREVRERVFKSFEYDIVAREYTEGRVKKITLHPNKVDFNHDIHLNIIPLQITVRLKSFTEIIEMITEREIHALELKLEKRKKTVEVLEV